MVISSKRFYKRLSAILLMAVLSACGSKSSSPVPTTIPNSESIFYAHNLVFRNNTTLLACGYNGFGQLGTGTLANPTTAITLGKPLFSFSGVATGGNFTIGFYNNSTVRSWGYNGYGQLGNNTIATASTTAFSSIPVPVKDSTGTANLSGVKAVAAGVHHALALSGDTLWAWGENTHGQLGVDLALTPPTENKFFSPVARRVNAGGVVLSNISSIAANAYHSLARANGKVYAWGYNGTGQLGIDTATQARSVPDIVPGLPSEGISGIAAGGAFSYAVARDANRTVRAWGYNGSGQLGDGTKVSHFAPEKVLRGVNTDLTDIVQVAAGVGHGLALDIFGNVWAWGYNHFGQLGDNSSTDSPYAKPVVIDAAGTLLSGVTEVRAFGSSSMARKGNVWYVWGDNSFGQLGFDPKTATNFLLPQKMPGF